VRKVQMEGFKSFGELTTATFTPDLNVIVGKFGGHCS